MSTPKVIILLFVLLIGLGMRIFFYNQSTSTYQNDQKISINVRLTEEPQIKFNKQKLRIKVGNGEKITIITGLSTVYQYGDRIRISGVISQKEYKSHIYYALENPDIQIQSNDQNFVSSSATYIRRKAKSIYQNSLSPVSSSLLIGIVFGGNQGMPDKFVKELRNVGVIHVIAASGMNVTFVASALIGVLGRFFKRRIALTIAILGIIFYAYLAGFEASIIRAAIMAIMAFSANIFGRQNLSLLALTITGYIMLFLTPNLISDVGFQLSFLATLGILVIKPLIPSRNIFLLDDIGTTIAAQAATIPVLLSVFGSYGLLSILVNALVLWTVPVLMILGSLALIFGMIFEPIGRIFIYLSEPILFFFEKVVIYFGNMELTITIPSVSVALWIGYYLMLFSVVILINQYRTKKSLSHEKTA